MAEGVADGVCQFKTQNGRNIYDLITANNLPEISVHFNSLTIRHRQSIVSQKVGNTTLLGHACSLGFRHIVKYLLAECEADISDGYTPHYARVSPLRIAINNLDVLMINLLLRRGAIAADKHEAHSCVEHLSKNDYFCIEFMLIKYSDTGLWDSTLQDPTLFTWLTNTHMNDADPFLLASASGDIGALKILMENGIYLKVKNQSEENALCIAILNGKRNAEHFLLNYRVFSFKAHVQAMELCGAKFIVFESNFQDGFQCWRNALRKRTEYFFGVSDKFLNPRQTDLGAEFSSEEELDVLENCDAEIYVQGLMVFLRLIIPSSQILQDAFVRVARHTFIRNDLLQATKILATLSELPVFAGSLVSPITTAFVTLEYLLRRHFRSNLLNKADIIMKFSYMMDFVNRSNWQLLLSRPGQFYPVLYTKILRRILCSTVALNRLNPSEKDKAWMTEFISKLMTWHPDPYPTTLLHLSIASPTTFSLISLLVSISGNVNCKDNLGNTPMHIVSFLQDDKNYILSIVNLLVDAGAHIDSLNKYGETPLSRLLSDGVIKNPLKYLSLKCLAALTIGVNNVNVPDFYPKKILRFIKIHSK